MALTGSNRRGRGKKRKKPTMAETWAELADRLEGSVTTSKKGKPKGIEFPHDGRIVTVDTYTVSTGQSSVTYSRARLALVVTDEFRCKIFSANLFTALGVRFGMQDMTVGRRELDKRYVFQGSSESTVRSLVLGTRVGQLLTEKPTARLEVKPLDRKLRKVHGEDARQVVVQTGMLKEVTKLQRLADLCTATSDQIVRLGLVAERPIIVDW